MASVRAKRPKLAGRCWRLAVPKAARSFPPEPKGLGQDKNSEQNQQGSANSVPLRVSVIKKRPDFLALRNAKTSSRPPFLMAARKNAAAGEGARIGITVTKKVGSAVVRNRIRRRLRAAARETFPQFASAGTDYVLIARKAAYDRNYAALLDDMKRALLSLARDTK